MTRITSRASRKWNSRLWLAVSAGAMGIFPLAAEGQISYINSLNYFPDGLTNYYPYDAIVGVAVSPVNGDVYVVDKGDVGYAGGSGAIDCFDPNLNSLGSIPFPIMPAGAPYQYEGANLAVDASGILYVTAGYLTGGAGGGALVPEIDEFSPNSASNPTNVTLVTTNFGGFQGGNVLQGIAAVPNKTGLLQAAYSSTPGPNEGVVENLNATINLGEFGFPDLTAPFGIAIDSAGNTYVADTANNDVVMFNGGSHNPTFFGAGTLNSPLGVAVAANSSGGTNIYVISGNSLVVYNGNNLSSPQETFTDDFLPPDNGNFTANPNGPITNPYGVAVMPTGQIYLTEAAIGNGHSLVDPAARLDEFFDPTAWTSGVNTFPTFNNVGLGSGNGSNRILGASSFTLNSNMGLNPQNLTVDLGTFTEAGGEITTSNETIGDTLTGSFNQSGGTNTITNNLYIGYSNGSIGQYNLSQANVGDNPYELTVDGNEYVGYNGEGTFNQTGGTHTVEGNLYIGYLTGTNGTYTISGGNLVVDGAIYVGINDITNSAGIGQLVILPGGKVTVDGTNLSDPMGSGIFLEGGELDTTTLNLNNDPSLFVWTSGTLNITGTSSSVIVDTGADATLGNSYTLGAGMYLSVNSNEIVGDVGTGTFIQTGGSNTVTNTVADFYLGYASGSMGVYNLGGTSAALNVTGRERIGQSGAGVFNQSGGTNTITGNLDLANQPGSTGTYYLSAGTLAVSGVNAGIEYVGDGGTGAFIQTGGTNTISASLVIGNNSGSSGTYALQGGALFADQAYVAGAGLGTLTVSGTGQMTVTDNLTLNANGAVSATNETVGGGSAGNATIVIGPDSTGGVGTFTQTGGANNATELDIGVTGGSTGTFNMSGGTATISDNISVGFVSIPLPPNFTFSAGTGTLTVSGAGQVIAGNSMNLNYGSVSASAGESIGGGLGANLSILVEPYVPAPSPGGPQGIGVGTFTQTGGANTTPVLYLGYTAYTAGVYNLSGATNGGNPANLIVGGNEYLGYCENGSIFGGAGLFNQTGGTNKVGASLYVGDYPGILTSTYDLSNPAFPTCTLTFNSTGTNLTIGGLGQFNLYGNLGTPPYTTPPPPSPGVIAMAPADYFGGYLLDPNGIVSVAAAGQFYNDGGYVDPAALDLSGTFTQVNGIANFGQINDDGAMNISGGIVAATAGEYVGNNAAGTFNLSGGTNVIGGTNGLVVGNSTVSTGTFVLSGTGTLVVGASGDEIVGDLGTGTFIQTGGSNTVTNTVADFYLGYAAGSSGTYNLSGTSAALNVTGRERIGQSGVGVFNQSGGTNTITGNLDLANQPGSTGTYYLSAGTLAVSGVNAGIEYVGDAGTGNFNQSGGTNTIGTSLAIGNNSGSIGTYTLSGGLLQVDGNAYVGGSSTGPGGTGALTVNNSGQLSVAGTLQVYSTGRVNLDVPSTAVGNLSVAGNGIANINGALTINYGSPGNDPVSSIVTLLKNGYSGGTWTGTGTASIISTSVSAGPGKPILSVGYADGNTDNGTAAGPNQIVVKYTLAGDANLDGQVNSADLLAVIQNFNKTGTDWAHGNFTYITSGKSTTSADLLDVIQNFNQTLPPPAGSAVTIGATTIPLSESVTVQSNVPMPEPSAAGVALAGLAGLLFRRNRKSSNRKA